MNQMSIDFTPPRAPFQRHSPTSKAAALAAEPGRETKRGLLLDLLRRLGPVGATDEEMQLTLRMPANTQRPRRVELALGGHIKESGTTRPTLSGHAAVVWVVKGQASA